MAYVDVETKDGIALAPEHQERVVHENLDDAKPRYRANADLDDAARILDEAGGQHDFDVHDRKRVVRKIDFWVCFPMCLVYFLVQCDKASLSYAAVFDLQTSNHLVGSQYSWLTSCVYLAQLVCQPMSSYALIVFPGERNLSTQTA
jgi:hypothetical protein